MAFRKLSMFFLLFSYLTAPVVCREFFSSVHEMTKVFGYEQKMLEHMQKFLAANQGKLDFLKARLREFEGERQEALDWGPAYFDSPLNKYLLNKRLTVDWQQVENLMETATGKKPLARLQKLRNLKSMPQKSELEGALDGLLRLQFVYRLKAKDIARGILDGVQYGARLNSEHCVDLARLALRDKHPRLAHSWLLEARDLATNEAANEQLMAQILALLVQSKAELGDYRGMNDTYQELLKLQPASEEHAKSYESFLEAHGGVAALNDTKNIEEHAPVPEKGTPVSEFEGFCLTCSGHWRPSPQDERSLQCGYMSETHPFLWIAPLKAEELSHNPLVVLYHDVIYQSEIDTIRNLVTNKLKRAEVAGFNETSKSNVRTSQNTFLPQTEDKVLATIDRRVADMTNLNMKYAEDHQISNYGIGGHYGPHMDWFHQVTIENGLVSTPEMGNRIATVLFYLSDVTQGGGTVFPHLMMQIKPKKYSGTVYSPMFFCLNENLISINFPAVFWHNLHASGVGDVRTLHAACPIIAGSKWVLNRWIREFVQADRRPCVLWDDSLVTMSQLLEMHKQQEAMNAMQAAS
ncbi:hypothetical protein KR018_008879 [Drosophila ironensis]|nr:hypothetical protein KR018_008879 [Drosophila ironensis]